MNKNLLIFILICSSIFPQIKFKAGMINSGIAHNISDGDSFFPAVSNDLNPTTPVAGLKIGIEYNLNPNLITGIAYTQRGIVLEGINVNDRITLNYLTLHTMLPISFPLFNSSLLLGGELGMFLNGSIDRFNYFEDWNDDPEIEISRDMWVINNNPAFDYGILLGLKKQFHPDIALNLIYYLGIGDLSPSPNSINIYNRSFECSLSFTFINRGEKETRSRNRNNSYSEDSGGCAAPSKKYGNADLDNFLQTSYDICVSLQEAEKLLSEVNEFLENPTLYVTKKVSKEISEVKSQVEEVSNLGETVSKEIQDAIEEQKNYFKTKLVSMIQAKLPGIITGVGETLGASGGAVDAAKGLSGMDKFTAIKDAASAAKNLKTIGQTAPKVLDQLNSLLSKF